jgi:hypothetical protein
MIFYNICIIYIYYNIILQYYLIIIYSTVEYWIPPQRNSAAGIYSAFVEVICGDPPQFYFDIFWFWGFPSEKMLAYQKEQPLKIKVWWV